MQMNLSELRRDALSVGVAAMLAGCGGSQPPLGAPGAMPQSSQITTQAARGESWMLPEAVTQNLLYISNVRTVTVYSYPKGKLKGTLKHFYIATGECVDKKGDVFIVDDGYGRVFMYGHGGTKRVRTLVATGNPVGCSIDPTTGNLAVTTLGHGSNGSIEIFKNAGGNPTPYQDSAFQQMYFCGYDDKGNLFVDGVHSPGGTGDFVFAELPKGSSIFTNIVLNQYIGFPGGVQWDGKHVAIGDQTTNIYEFAINGSTGTIAGTTQMGSGAQYVKQFWIQGRTVIAPNVYAASGSDVFFYKYPGGGDATKTITKGITDAQGSTVSLAPNR
jgi:hypothetical protein